MQQIMKRAALGILGVVVTLAYWSFTGGGSDAEVRGIPSKVWEGGSGTLTVEVEASTPARFAIGFSKDGKEESLNAWTPVSAGSHAWAIEVPAGAGGYIDLNAENPKVGDKLSWKILLNGETVEEQSETLDAPLEQGYAFGLVSHYDDYSTMTVEED
jgi:hypothetical protein